MSNKRKLNHNFEKTTIILDDFTTHPTCPHGPQVLFERGGRRFYSCAAFRSSKECLKNSSLNVRNKQENKGLAQYLFTQTATKFFTTLLQSLNQEFVLCIGVPSIHDSLQNELGIKSYLLDLDKSLVDKFAPNSSHYNMCNHHFFDGDNSSYKKFLKTAAKQHKTLTIVTDPPFGARPQLLAHIHQLIERDFTTFLPQESSNAASQPAVNIVWIAPYFLEGHIKKANSTLAMSDYQVNYSNHTSFSEGEKRSRKEGSPVRFFTNIPLRDIQLPPPYKYCEICQRFVAATNRHCNLCDSCTSKDGKTYRHCVKCEKCVKPTWSHCDVQGKCCGPESNNFLQRTSKSKNKKQKRK